MPRKISSFPDVALDRQVTELVQSAEALERLLPFIPVHRRIIYSNLGGSTALPASAWTTLGANQYELGHYGTPTPPKGFVKMHRFYAQYSDNSHGDTDGTLGGTPALRVTDNSMTERIKLRLQTTWGGLGNERDKYTDFFSIPEDIPHEHGYIQGGIWRFGSSAFGNATVCFHWVEFQTYFVKDERATL